VFSLRTPINPLHPLHGEWMNDWEVTKNASLPTHWKIKMAMQVKHTVTIGLGLGIATALGYHFLSNPKNQPEVRHAKQMTPLNAFKIAPIPPAISTTTPVPVQPQLDNHFRVEAQPLQQPYVQSLPRCWRIRVTGKCWNHRPGFVIWRHFYINGSRSFLGGSRRLQLEFERSFFRNDSKA